MTNNKKFDDSRLLRCLIIIPLSCLKTFPLVSPPDNSVTGRCNFPQKQKSILCLSDVCSEIELLQIAIVSLLFLDIKLVIC